MKINLREIAAASDQRAAILEATANAMQGMDVLRNRIIVATYVVPEKTKGGIIRPDRNIDESRFQGKVGLILKKGPMAFKFDDDQHPSPEYEVGDWVFYRTSDTMEIGIAGTDDMGISCRHVFDDQVIGRVQDPESIW